MGLSEENRRRVLLRWDRTHLRERKRIIRNEELMARLCGFLAGDGSVKIRTERGGKIHHTVEFYPDDESLIAPYVESLNKLYGKQPKIEIRPNHYRLRLYSKVVTEDLLKFSPFGIYSWCLPGSLFTRLDSKKEWLRAFFDSEAYVDDGHIRVQSVNASGLGEVLRLLAEFGIHSRLYSYQPKISGWSKVSILVITRKADRLKFLNKIGFNHKNKLKRLNSFLCRDRIIR